MNRFIYLIAILLSQISTYSFATPNCSIIVKDPIFGEKIAFMLTAIKQPEIPAFKTDKNLTVHIKSNILADQKYKKVLFGLEFTSALSKKLYVKRLVRGNTPIPVRTLNSYSGYYLKDLCTERNGQNQLTVQDLERGRKSY